MRRRDFLQSAFVLSALASSDVIAAERSTRAEPFSYAALKGRARATAGAEYRPPQRLAPDFLRGLTYDQYQAIRFRHDHALWAQDDGAFRLEFFHCGRGFKEPVDLYEIVRGRGARDPLPAGDVRVRRQRHRHAPAARRPVVRGLSRPHLDQLGRGRRGVSRRQLLSRQGQRLAAVRPVRARPRRRHGGGGRRVSALRRVLVRAAEAAIRARWCSTGCSTR